MANQYDVIIIGSGAGGGTLARHLAPSGKRILLLERGGWLPREPRELGCRGSVRQKPLRLAGDLVRQGRQAVPARRPLFRRRRDQDVRRRALPAAARRLRRDRGTTTASRRPGPSATTSSSRITPRPSSMYHVHGARGEDPTEPPASAPYPLPGRVARAAHRASCRRPRPGRLPSVPLALRHHARRGADAV